MIPTKLGGLEEYALHLSKELTRRGHFAAVGFLDYPPDWLLKEFKSSGIEVLKFNPSVGGLPFIRDLRKTIKKYNINILHATFYPFYSPYLIMTTMGSSCKLIYSDQESRASHPSRGWTSMFRFFRNRIYQKYIHAIVADAEFVRDCQIRDHFTKPSKLPVIYNGVNLERFRKASNEQRANILSRFNVPPDSSVIVTIAQCSWGKGLNYFIDAANIILKDRPHTTFFIVGDGPEKSVYEAQSLGLGLQNSVIFTGMRVDTELFLSVADVFVLLSVWEEAFAFTLLEAMASGCPVVATRIGAIPESVQEGVTGILVPPRSPQAAAEAILTLLNDNPLRSRMSLAAIQRIENHFSIDLWVNQTINFYENAFGD
jgi:glycosyltransferase involved in cell wall biosynthesis